MWSAFVSIYPSLLRPLLSFFGALKSLSWIRLIYCCWTGNMLGDPFLLMGCRHRHQTNETQHMSAFWICVGMLFRVHEECAALRPTGHQYIYEQNNKTCTCGWRWRWFRAHFGLNIWNVLCGSFSFHIPQSRGDQFNQSAIVSRTGEEKNNSSSSSRRKRRKPSNHLHGT